MNCFSFLHLLKLKAEWAKLRKQWMIWLVCKKIENRSHQYFAVRMTEEVQHRFKLSDKFRIVLFLFSRTKNVRDHSSKCPKINFVFFFFRNFPWWFSPKFMSVFFISLTKIYIFLFWLKVVQRKRQTESSSQTWTLTVDAKKSEKKVEEKKWLSSWSERKAIIFQRALSVSLLPSFFLNFEFYIKSDKSENKFAKYVYTKMVWNVQTC